MPVTRQEQDSTEGAARGKQLPEPSLRRLRGSLVGTRYEVLKTAAFSAVLIVSLCMIAGGAGLLSPDNQFYADAREALRGLAGHASSGADTVGARIQVAAASAASSVSRAIASDNRGAASPPVAQPNATKSSPVAAGATSNPHHAAKAAAPVHRKTAHHHRHRAEPAPPAAPPAPAPQQATAPLLDTLSDTLNDEFSKAYYGVVNFCADEFPSAGNSARDALDTFTRMLGIDPEPTTFDPSHPETIFQILTSTSTLMMLVGVVLFLIIAGVFAMSVKDSLRNVSHRLRTRRSGGYA